MNAVVDTNVMVSAIMKENSPPSEIIWLFKNGLLDIIVDSRILAGYRDVLLRPRLSKWIHRNDADAILEKLENDTISVVPTKRFLGLPDQFDAPFIAVAWEAQCPLVTGNIKHFPCKIRDGVRVLSPKQFLETAL